jgi:hypothetical protein
MLCVVSFAFVLYLYKSVVLFAGSGVMRRLRRSCLHTSTIKKSKHSPPAKALFVAVPLPSPSCYALVEKSGFATCVTEYLCNPLKPSETNSILKGGHRSRY